MRIIPTLQLVPGMIVAEDVLSLDQKFILEKGTRLTDAMITRLDLYGVLSVAIQKDSASPATSWAAPTQTYYERIKTSPEFVEFKGNYMSEVISFKEKLNSVITRNAPLNVQGLIDDALKMVHNFNGRIGIFDMLHNIRVFDDSTFSHCMNVGLICYIFAGWLKMDKKDAETATACGLLHDIGKLLIPKDILTKPGKLTQDEFEEIKKHPTTGYKLLQSQEVNEVICLAALMHHERLDGSGYPLGLTDTKIHKFAKLVAIADVYDAMTSSRVYRGPLCPFTVIEMFEAEGFQKYDTNYILTFLENIVNTYLTNPCRLNDGREGTIVMINKHKLSRPIVKCGEKYINLADTADLHIECLL
ncbi:MAG: HD-GYP domain-containing protein [Lachnospiraceae bacterium]|nr:HD-GYP domain-containing protein [Lachnospiraceae bacterium]